MPNVEESIALQGHGPTCRWHDDMRLDVHDLKASDKRQWDKLLTITTTLEKVENSNRELAHSIDLTNKAIEHHMIVGHNGRNNKEEKKPDTVDRLVNIFWRVVELVAVGTLLWALSHAIGGVSP